MIFNNETLKTECSKDANNKSIVRPIYVGMTTILAIVLFGRRFN